MSVCKALCCRSDRCDVAVMMKNGCFLLTCKSEELCKPRKAQTESFSLKLAYRDKMKEKEETETEVENDEDDDNESDEQTSTTTTVLPQQNDDVYPTQPAPVLLQPLNNNNKQRKPISNTIPPVLRPQKGITSWCSPSFILTGVELNGGIKSGPSKILGNVSSIQECVSECCRVPDCTVAYTEGRTCYAVLCLNQNICQARISTPSKSLGYVVRNGWSLFPSEQNAFKGASFLNTQRPEMIPDTTIQTTTIPTTTTTATTTTATTTIETTLATTSTIIPKNISIDISSIMPEATINKTKSCHSNGTITNHRFVAGMKAGIFTDHGELSDVDDMLSCVKYCCLDKLCDVAYMVGRRCYTLQCFSRQTCRTFPAPNFFLNPVIAFVVRSKPPKVDIISVDYIKHNYTVPLTNSTFRNSSMTDQPNIKVKLSKKTMSNSSQSNENDEFVEDQAESGSGSGIDSPGFTRGHVPNGLLDQFEKTQEQQPKERYYFPLSDVDTNVIKSLSDDKDFTECNSTQYGCEHFCISLLHGGPRCMCRNGYQLALDGQHCLYEGECEPKAHGCDQVCRFVTDGFQCLCRSGYVLHKEGFKSSCQDLDECAMDMHSCSHDCLNTPGSYVCQCPTGYQLASDQLNCKPIDGGNNPDSEAWKKNDIPGPYINQSLTIPPKIVNVMNTTEVTQGESVILQCKTQGSPEPITVWTFGENFTTIAIGYGRFKMLPGGDLMIVGAQMQDTGKYTCVTGNVGGTDTASGYLLVNDVDECATGKHNCSHLCTNTYGGFECSCYQGYTLLADQSTCQDVNECEMFNDCDHYCWNTEGSYTCSCRQGYQLQQDQRLCQDIDECDVGSHQCQQNCTNTQGSYFCSCKPGFNLSSIDHVTCEGNDELTNTTIPIHHGNHTNITIQHNIHPHLRSGRTTRRFLHLVTIITLVVTLILVSVALYFMWRNYKKRWRMKEATCNMNEPPVKSRCSAMFSWK